jgi:hypothetical protein
MKTVREREKERKKERKKQKQIETDYYNQKKKDRDKYCFCRKIFFLFLEAFGERSCLLAFSFCFDSKM